LPPPAREPHWHRLARQFRSPLIYILLGALALDLGLWLASDQGEVPLDAIAIAFILILNAALGFWQENKSEQALAQLERLTTPKVSVYRDGKLTELPSPELVPGDAVLLEAGARVPADGVAIEPVELGVDESVLTGESLPVDRQQGEELLAGTLVVKGRAVLEVTRIGAASAMGRLATMLGQVKQEPTPLERRLDVFGRKTARWVIALAVVLAVAGLVTEGPSRLGPVVLFAVAVAVAAVPEGLPAVLTATLASGVERMAGRKAVVRKLAAVEALGSVTVIATDKTGTLTENRMEMRELDSPDRDRAIAAMAVANDAESEDQPGDPVDQALLRGVREAGADPAKLRADRSRRGIRPFDSATKFMSVTVSENGNTATYIKGAPEVVLERSTLSAEERSSWTEKVAAHAAAGYRVVALARGDGESDQGLAWLGVALLWDPPRAEVPAAIKAATAAGIRVVMLTGDHPTTAATVARSIGLPESRVLAGPEIEGMSPDALREALDETGIFARVTPEHKLRIVEALQARGEIVAATGDGVNDAAALKRADVGVAMGQRGSDVTREVADLVVLDDNFATIVAAVEEGRSIYENIQKFVRFLFSTNFSELLVVAIGALAAFLLDLRDSAGLILVPVTAAQLLWINLVTDGAPALALGFDKNPGVMGRPPRDPKSPLLDRESISFILLSGSIKALAAFGLLGILPWLAGQSLDSTRAAVFVFLAAGQLLFAYPARRTELEPAPNPLLHIAVAVGFALQVLTLIVPALQKAFATSRVTATALVAAVAAMVLSWAGAELVSRIVRRRTKGRADASIRDGV